MGLKSAIQEALDGLAQITKKSSEDQIFEESVLQRRDDREKILAQVDDARQEILTLNESIRNLEEAQKQKTAAMKAKKSELISMTSELQTLREENRYLSEQIKQFRQRKIRACSEFSTKDVAALEDTKMKLRACCILTGVHFNASEKSVSGGYVANTATKQVKLFDVGNLPRKDATRKLWEAIEKTTALQE